MQKNIRHHQRLRNRNFRNLRPQDCRNQKRMQSDWLSTVNEFWVYCIRFKINRDNFVYWLYSYIINFCFFVTRINESIFKSSFEKHNFNFVRKLTHCLPPCHIYTEQKRTNVVLLKIMKPGWENVKNLIFISFLLKQPALKIDQNKRNETFDSL